MAGESLPLVWSRQGALAAERIECSPAPQSAPWELFRNAGPQRGFTELRSAQSKVSGRVSLG